MAKITIEQCCCPYEHCSDYWLVGIGKFVQGSGFTQEEAQRIADLLNGDETRLEKAHLLGVISGRSSPDAYFGQDEQVHKDSWPADRVCIDNG